MGSAHVRIGAVVASVVVAAGMTGMMGAAVTNALPCNPGSSNNGGGGSNNTGGTVGNAGYSPDTTAPGPTIVTVSCDHVPEQTPSAPTPPQSTVTVQTNTGTAPSLPSRVPQTPKQPTQPTHPPVIVPQPTVAPLPLTIAPVPPPPPVVIPTPPPPAPAPPAPNVMLTSSVDTGTQSLAIILVFLVIGSWFYANRIVSQWTLGKKAHASGSA